MFFSLLAQIYLDFGIKFPYILRITPQKTEELVEIMFMRLIHKRSWF